MTEPQLLAPIHQLLDLSREKLPGLPAWERLSPHWPAPEDRDLPGQYEAKVKLFRRLATSWEENSENNTWRALCADLRLYFDWCRAWELPALPSTPQAVADFVVDQAKDKSKSSVLRYLASIAKAHTIARLDNPVTDPTVTDAFNGRYKHDYSEPQQSEGLRWNLIEIALRQLEEKKHKKELIKNREIQDSALMRVMYDCLLRASEVERLTVTDLSRDQQGYRLRVVRAKKRATSRQSAIKYKYIHETTAAAIEAWWAKAGITDGAMFRGIAKNDQVLETPLSTKGVNRAVRRIAKAAGQDPRGFSGHACRIGACQDLLAAGIDMGRVMLAGDWERQEMPAYYGRKMALDLSGIAELSALQLRK